MKLLQTALESQIYCACFCDPRRSICTWISTPSAFSSHMRSSFFFFTAVTVLGFPEINKASIIKRTVLICSSVYKATAPWSRRTKESQAMLRFLQVPLGLSVTQLLEEVGHGESATATANREAIVSVLMFLLQRPNEKQHVRGCVCASVVFIREKQGGVIGM